MPTVSGRVIQCLRMLSDTLVPDDNCPGVIPDSAGEIVTPVDMIEEKFQNAIYMFGLVSHGNVRLQGVARTAFIVIPADDGFRIR